MSTYGTGGKTLLLSCFVPTLTKPPVKTKHLSRQTDLLSARIARMWSTKPVIAILLVTACLGCRDVQYSRVLLDREPLRRVISLSPGATEVAAVYLSVPLIGRTASDDYPPAARNLAVVMNGTKPDMEKIESLGAKAALYDPATTGQQELDKLKAQGIRVMPVGGNTLDAYVKSLYAIAALTGAESNTDDYIQDHIYAKLAGAQVQGSPTAAFIMPGNGSEDMIAGTDTFQADILKHVGARPVGPDAKSFVPLNAEQFVKDDPDVILVAGDPRPVASDPRFASLKAVKSKHVYGLNQDIALREGARVPDLIENIGDCLNLAAKS